MMNFVYSFNLLIKPFHEKKKENKTNSNKNEHIVEVKNNEILVKKDNNDKISELKLNIDELSKDLNEIKKLMNKNKKEVEHKPFNYKLLNKKKEIKNNYGVSECLIYEN
jgi:TolA-binding protein